MTDIYQFDVQKANGDSLSMETFKGQHLLIVNTASRCGFTNQYAGLETLHKQFDMVTVLAFPCNQFGAQEPGSDAEIQEFCQLNYQLSFPVMAKIEVNGANTHPLYAHLKKAAPGLMGTQDIKWNFTKFWVTETGVVRKRFAPQDTPESIAKTLQNAL